jgi:hypothetical protein
MRRGDIVISHLTNYRLRHGAYPSSLDLLQKTVRTELPLPEGCSGHRWQYVTRDATFQLSFTPSDSEYPIWFYNSSDGEWHADQ